MIISKCGYACEVCNLKPECGACVPENEARESCVIMQCSTNDSCMQCDERLGCKTYKDGLRHCPLRIGVLKKREA